MPHNILHEMQDIIRKIQNIVVEKQIKIKSLCVLHKNKSLFNVGDKV